MDTLPRLDLHRHFGGSLSPSWVWQAICSTGQMELAESYKDVVKAMTFASGEPYDFHRFLGKFDILDDIKWDHPLIESSIRDICYGLALDRIDYTWLRFAVNKYVKFMPTWSKSGLVGEVARLFKQYAPNRVGLVLSLKYDSPPAAQRQYLKLIEDRQVLDNVVGVDLVGDEGYFDHQFYGPLLKPWRDAGKLIFAHVGESQSSDNIRLAAEHLGVTEICHGIKADDATIDYAVKHDLCFHMAITSNVLTGVWDGQTCHPLAKIMRAGVKCTIGTDDPVQCSTNLDREFQTCEKVIGLTGEELTILKQTAYDRARKTWGANNTSK